MFRFLLALVLIFSVSFAEDSERRKKNNASANKKKTASSSKDKKNGKDKKKDQENPRRLSSAEIRELNANWVHPELNFLYEPTPKEELTVPEKPAVTENKPKPEEVKPKPNIELPTEKNTLMQFFSEYKKVFLVVGIVVIFALYRLRNGVSRSSQGSSSGRIFSKFNDK